MVEKLSAAILDVYYKDINTPVELGESKGEPAVLDAFRFKREPRFSMELQFGPEPSDGMHHALLIGMFIDGIEAPFVTDWLKNSDQNRTRVLTFNVPKSPVKLMKPGKVHTVQFKIGGRAYKFGIPMNISPREYDLGESAIFYYKFPALGDGDAPGGWDSGGSSGSGNDDGGGGCGGSCGGPCGQ